MPPDEWRVAGSRLNALTAGNPQAEQAARVVTDLYGAGLDRLLGLLHDAGALTGEVLAAITADELVAGLLLVHGLHPDDTATRVRRALAGTGAELIEVTAGGVCRVRMPHGRPPPGLRERIEAAAPEVTDMRAETLCIPAAENPRGNQAALIPVEALFARRVAEHT